MAVTPPAGRHRVSADPIASRRRMTIRDRLRSILDERRWLDYARSPTSIFLRWQPFRPPPGSIQ